MNHRRSSIFPIALIVLVAFNQPHAAEPGHQQQAAHVHGEALLLIALEGKQLAIELHSPAMNIVGFEHPPGDSAERAAVEAAIATLQQPALLFDLPTAAQCAPMSVEITGPMTEDEAATEHDEPHADEQEESHSEFTGHYQFGCADVDQLNAIVITIFERFPATGAIEVQSISERGQQRLDLTPSHNILEL